MAKKQQMKFIKPLIVLWLYMRL